MDNLSKLGFLAAEYLLAGTGGFSAEEADKVGIVVANANSSTDTDVRYDKQVKQNLASPALFVYTLPNIVLGEICIRHGIKGENTLFISDSYDAQAQVSYVSSLFDNELIDNCLGGWIDFLNQEYQAFFYLAGESSQQDLPTYSTENVEMLLN